MFAQLMHRNPDVYRIQGTFANGITAETNCYVVRDGDDALVVDTGAPSDAAEAFLREVLRELGIDAGQARYFLTHSHFDHVGLVPRLARSGACVYANKHEVAAFSSAFAQQREHFVCQRFTEEGVPARFAHADNARINVSVSFDGAPFEVSVVEEGDEIAVGRYTFEVVNTPGHMALYHAQSGICFTGDHVLFVISPGIPVYVDGDDSLDAYFTSLDKVARLGCSQLLISHGESRSDFLDRIAWLKRHHLSRLDAIGEIVKEQPGLSGCEVIRRTPWNIPFATVDECDPLQRWSIYAQGTALLDHMVATGRLQRVRELDEPTDAFVNRYQPAGM